MSKVELGGATVFPSLGARIPPTYVSQREGEREGERKRESEREREGEGGREGGRER